MVRCNRKWEKNLLRLFLLLFLTALVIGCSEQPKLNYLNTDATILAFGDSLTYGFGAKKDEAYPAVLQKLINRRVVNAGFNGLTTIHAAQRLQHLVTKYNPSLVIICIGGNDMLRKVKQATTIHNIETMLQMLQNKGINIVLLSVPQPGILLSPPKFYKQLAKKYNIPLDNKTVPKLESNPEFKSDTIHLNAAGYKKLAENIAQLLKDSGAI